MIVGAPKAGNVWLKHLLSDLYHLPMVDVSGLVDPREALTGEQFITHQHILPRKDFTSWGTREGVQFITMARHPGDLFLSLYHYVQNYGEQWRKAGILGQAPSHEMLGEPLDGQKVLDYLAGPFYQECLGKTFRWVEVDRAILVRYEDLHESAVASLGDLTSQLGVTPHADIAQTVEKHSFNKMKRHAGRKMKRHFRAGKVGHWAHKLSDAHLDAIRERHEPVLESFDYSLDRSDAPEPTVLEPSEKPSIWQRLFGS